MKIFQSIVVVAAVGLVITLVSCIDDSQSELSTVDFAKSFSEQLITAKPGDVISIPEGSFEFTRGLSLKVDGVTIRGAGIDKSVLSFKNQIQGAEGLMITANDITLENFAVEDVKGDAIKMNECTNLIVRQVRVEWTNGPSTDNGAYGLYPVQCQHVLIDGAVAIGASDAGIYVGQSDNVIVKNSRAEFNVAGIEIENTTNADVFDNVAINNTGGILVFNMPNLPKPGEKTRVFNNQIVSNNTPNFAPEGTAVSTVPTGSGVIINSNDKVQVFDNKIGDNITGNVLISSFFSAGYSDRSTKEDFDPYPESIYIHGNEFFEGGNQPARENLLALRNAVFGEDGSLPDILWDGFVNPEKLLDGKLPAEQSICIENGEAVMVNIDAPNDSANISVDMTNHRCQHAMLEPVVLPFE